MRVNYLSVVPGESIPSSTFTIKRRRFLPAILPVKFGKGLTGGHSGDDIHKGRGNSNKILNRFLWNAPRSLAYG